MLLVHNAFVLRFLTKLRYYSNMAQEYSEIIYKSLDSVLSHLNKPQFKHLNGVQELLNIYSSVISKTNTYKDTKFPLIVLEGLDGCGKSTQTARLTNAINAELCCTPPPCIKPIRDKFDSCEYKEVRTAYYALGNYIAALQIQEILQDRPVVLDRFWHSTASYAIAQAIADYPDLYKLPPTGHDIYNWPEDLLQPDYIGYLCVNEEIRLNRLKNRTKLTDQENLLQAQAQFRNNVVAVYYRILPTFHPINAQLSKKKVSDQVLNQIRPLLPKDWEC